MRRACASGIAAMALFAGCGDRGTDQQMEADAAVETPPSADSVGMGLPTPRDADRPAGSLGDVSEGEIVVATVETRAIRLSRDTIPPGEVTVVIENRGQVPCALELTSQFYGRQRSAPVAPGRSIQMSMVLAKSPYYLFCAGGTAGVGQQPPRDSVRLVVY